jgi:hypothetical protein
MEEVKNKQWASAKANGDFICIDTYSGYRRCALDSEVKHYVFPSDVTDHELGLALLDCLARSRFLSSEEIGPFFDYRNVQKRYEEWVKSLMDRFQYKTRRSLFKNLASCDIESVDGLVVITPSKHEKLEDWSGDGISKEEFVTVSVKNPVEEIGSALKLAFGRCK